MTREEAVEFARKAGHPQPNMDGLFHQRFANLVAAAEREKAAVVCESTCWRDDIDAWMCMTKRDVADRSMHECAAAIRSQS